MKVLNVFCNLIQNLNVSGGMDINIVERNNLVDLENQKYLEIRTFLNKVF